MPGKRSNGEGILRKRSNGLWECTMMVGYKDDGTRRYKSFYGKSQKEAKDKAETYKRDIAAGLYIDPNLTFREWAQKWYDGYQDSVSPTTYESYGYTLKILIGAFGPRKLNTIKALDVEDFLKKLRVDGKSDSYLTKCRGMLYQIMHKAEANDLSCGGISFFSQGQFAVGSQLEVVIPITRTAPLLLPCQLLRQRDEGDGTFFYAAKFLSLLNEQESMIREAVFNVQLKSMQRLRR